MATSKTIERWEQERNMIFPDLEGDELAKEVTEEEFGNLVATRPFVGVNHVDRKKFLSDHGYDLTRDNLTDSTLSARAPE